MNGKVIVLGLVFMLLLGFVAMEDAKHSDEHAGHEHGEESTEQPGQEGGDDKNANYFTPETLKELANIQSYKNNRLWACYLLSSCKLRLEQV